MRIRIDRDDGPFGQAMRASPFTPRQEAVKAGLQLLARQAACRHTIKWQGKPAWRGDAPIGCAMRATPPAPAALPVQPPRAACPAVAQPAAKAAPVRPKARKKAVRHAGC